MTEHTPGPWTVGRFRFRKRGRDCSRVAVQGPDSHYIVDGVYQTSQSHNDEAEDNARLIAAAPDLLAALKAFVNRADFGLGSLSGASQSFLPQLAHARTAIAKVTEGTN